MSFIKDTDKLLLMGDFNLPGIDWSRGLRAPGDSLRYIMYLADLYDLKQCNNIPNFRGVLLDLIFSSIPDTVVTPASDPLLPEDEHHPALEVTVTVSQPAHSYCTKYIGT